MADTSAAPFRYPDSPVFHSTPAKKRRSLILVLCSTVLIAAAQGLIKSGTGSLTPNATLLDTAAGILTTPNLFAGYSLYGVVTVMMLLALRHAELSIVYPVIALSYVWVSILSVVLFHEVMNGFKIAGVMAIISGVAVLGKGNRA
jgi:multidrug transporter EmrE-like cation transporter